MKKTQNKQEKVIEIPEITFKCKFCEETKPLDQMRVLRAYFPPLVACVACEKAFH